MNKFNFRFVMMTFTLLNMDTLMSFKTIVHTYVTPIFKVPTFGIILSCKKATFSSFLEKYKIVRMRSQLIKNMYLSSTLAMLIHLSLPI